MTNMFLFLRKQINEIDILSDNSPKKIEVVLCDIKAIEITVSPSYVVSFALVLVFLLNIVEYHQVLLITA